MSSYGFESFDIQTANLLTLSHSLSRVTVVNGLFDFGFLLFSIVSLFVWPIRAIRLWAHLKSAVWKSTWKLQCPFHHSNLNSDSNPIESARIQSSEVQINSANGQDAGQESRTKISEKFVKNKANRR